MTKKKNEIIVVEQNSALSVVPYLFSRDKIEKSNCKISKRFL